MTEHEPECWIVSHSNPLNGCICTELRACEQRVLKDLVPNLQIADTQGFNRGLRQAREAVAGLQIGVLTTGTLLLKREDALAAIDALRGEVMSGESSSPTFINYTVGIGTGGVYPCDRGTGLPVGYHHYEASPNGVVVCRYCGRKP